MNPFLYKSAALRYSRGRPYFHPLVMARIRDCLTLTQPLTTVLDVGCGTGLSALALLEVSASVIGLDASSDMVALGPLDPRISYVTSAAECLPFVNDAFEMMTLSQVIHWLDLPTFLCEARRVIRFAGWLVVYDNFFSSRQPELGIEFEEWFEAYVRRFPGPPRADVPLDDPGTWSAGGFRLALYERYENRMRLSQEALIDYLTTQSNVIAAVEGRHEEFSEAKGWLADSTNRLFKDSTDVEFLFHGPIAYLQCT